MKNCWCRGKWGWEGGCFGVELMELVTDRWGRFMKAFLGERPHGLGDES